jgi:hypothetical protein
MKHRLVGFPVLSTGLVAFVSCAQPPAPSLTSPSFNPCEVRKVKIPD